METTAWFHFLLLASPKEESWLSLRTLGGIPRTALSFIQLKDAFLHLKEPPHSSKCRFSVYVWYGHKLFLRLQIGQVFIFGVRNSCLVVIFPTADRMLPGRQVIGLLHSFFSLV